MSKQATIAVSAAIATTAAGFGLYYIHQRNSRRKLIKQKVDQLVLVLDQQDCYVGDIAILREKIGRIINAGIDKLQVLTDFDRTLTKYYVDGQHGHASYGVIDDSSYISAAAVEELHALKNKYYPLEMSTSLTHTEKVPFMLEWWKGAFNVAVKSGVKKHLIPAMVRESRAILRDGTDQFFHIIKESRLPICIISAGIGDIVEEVLRQQVEVPPQLMVIANFYTYNSDGLVTGTKGDIIHTFNKIGVYEHNKPYFNKIKNRTNVILMGDTLGDPDMADGIKSLDTVIKIGFLNTHVEESMSQYLSAFDIVLTNDATMDIVNVFLQKLQNCSR